ncbi:hypothetical protein [Peribacillus asahii]|uniref:phage lytic cycle repressor MrpR family protein n=1 Tax=Peribacillus asahii TaxID=228899 RepID=UPI00380C4C87
MTMTKLNLKKVHEVRDNQLHTAVDGIAKSSFLRTKIEPLMVKVIKESKVKAILSKESNTSILTDEETIALFRIIFNLIKDNTFNPDNFILEEKEEEKKGSSRKKDYSVEIFHYDFKERFLNEHRVQTRDGEKSYSDETKRVSRILFSKLAKTERYYKKDICEFDNDQFEEALTSLNATTLRSLQNSISTLEQYIDFAIKEGQVSEEKGNVATEYSRKEVVSEFLDKKAEENMIFPQSEIYNLSKYSENAQDGVILSLLFDGVSYKHKFIEMRNIRIQDCDFDEMVINIPQLVDEDTGEILPPRQVPISQHTKDMIRNAMNEKKYASLTGKVSRNYKITEGDYILRGLRNSLQLKWENVSQRIIRISDINDYPYLNPTNISYSGQIHYAKELMEKEGLGIDEACRKIMKRFNIKDNESAFFYLKARIEKSK